MAVSPRGSKVERDVVSLAVKSMTARSDAASLRTEAATLRWTTKLIVRESKARRRSCVLSYARSRQRRTELPLHSPWSTLLWQRPQAELDQVLVPIPARPD